MNNPHDFDDLKRYLRPAAQDWDTDAAWSRMQQRMERPRRYAVRWLAAAIVILALGIGVLTRVNRSDTVTASAYAETHETQVGERRTVHLRDGSTVELAARSKLYVTGRGDERSVQLDGQAFFNVKRDEKHPFKVHARGVDVEVLGTSFDVAAYAGEDVKVGVASGRVKVKEAVLTRGQLATVTNNRVTLSRIDVASVSQWRSGNLSFRDVTFSEAAAAIERWHDVDIQIPDSTLARARVSAVFAQHSIKAILDVLAETLDARYTRDGTRATFHPN
jgi:transmembrane sensor